MNMFRGVIIKIKTAHGEMLIPDVFDISPYDEVEAWCESSGEIVLCRRMGVDETGEEHTINSAINSHINLLKTILRELDKDETR